MVAACLGTFVLDRSYTVITDLQLTMHFSSAVCESDITDNTIATLVGMYKGV